MSEAEVSLRLATWLASRSHARGEIEVAIDGAQVNLRKADQFDLTAFLASHDWQKMNPSGTWQDVYSSAGCDATIRVHSKTAGGDVVATLMTGRRLRVECKKGPLVRTESSPEYPIIREAFGQLLTLLEASETDILAIAVPHSPKFADLAERWRAAPLIRGFGIRILTVDRGGEVHGLSEVAEAS
jgi:hypothetical protein